MNDKGFEKKINVLGVFVYICFFIIVARLFYMQIIRGSYYEREALINASRAIPIEAPRGVIFDRKGKILARNSSKFSIYLLPVELREVSYIVDKLSKILSMSQKDIYNAIKEKEKNVFGALKLKSNISLAQVSKFEEVKDSLNGAYIQVEPLRIYSSGISGHLLGYIGEISEDELKEFKEKGYSMGDSIGKQGLERSYEEFLRGNPGKRMVLVDVYGNISSVLGGVEPVCGSTLYLTIDADLQKKAVKLLSQELGILRQRGINRVGAALVALNPKNGEILALVSLPSYDSEKFARGLSNKEYKKLLDGNFYPMLNRAVSSAFPPASTFKMVTGMAALEEGIVDKKTEFYCPGVFRLGNYSFNCFERGGHGKIKFTDAIAKSCDVAFYQLGYKMGIEKLLNYAEIFGLGQLTGIDLKEEVKGSLPDPQWKEKVLKEPWYVGDTVNLSIGQGYMEATPLQMALVTAIMANGGYYYKPFIVKRIISSDGHIQQKSKAVLKKKIDFSEENFVIFGEGMRKAVASGTAVGANIKEIEVAGKTGTAENFPTPGNPRGLNHTWFTGFAPYKAPEIVVTVFFEQSGGFGGDICAPIAAEIIKEYFKKEEK